MLILRLLSVRAFGCILDGDCSPAEGSGYNRLYCINNTCQRIKGPGQHCTLPQQCASYQYYGPLACSASCKEQGECSNRLLERTKFCCKAVPPKGECVLDRPRHLSGCAASHTCTAVGGSPMCVEKEGQSWLLGAACSIAGNILINCGINFQKKSYTAPALTLLGCALSTMLVGSVIYALGKIISFSAYIFGSQSMLAGLSATGLVSNSVFAPLINNEIFTWKDATAIAFVLTGTSIILHNTSHSHVAYSLCELMSMYRNRGTLLWLSFVLLATASTYVFIQFVEINSDWAVPGGGFQFLKSSLFFDADGFVCTFVMVFAYVFLSSLIASFTTLSAKSLGEIFDRALGGDNLLRSFPFYFFLCTLVGCTLLQIYWLNRALRHFDALLVMPIFHISWTILSILTAGIYFQDFDHYSRTQFRNFLAGVLVIFVGSVFLGARITNRAHVQSRSISVDEEQKYK
ncbi:magnesium transporter [Pancytospora philotis]|nr:magnesium transporter [Pancytospora philotis]